jgi:hypothetical protein
MKQLLARTREWKTTRTGKVESTGFTAADAAVATALNDVFSSAVKEEPRQHEQRYASFLARKPEDRVFVGKFDDVMEFLRAVRQAGAGRRSVKASDMPELNRDALPLINLSRGFDITYDNNDQEIDRHRYGSFTDQSQDNMPLAEIEATQASLNYSITLLASDKDTLSLMCNTLAANFRSRLATNFIAHEKLVRWPVEINCSIQDAKSIMFSDMSPPFTQERIYACQASMIVMVDVLTAHEVTARSVRHDTQLAPEGN